MAKRKPPATAKVDPETWGCALDAMKTSALKTSAFNGHWLAWVAYRRRVIKKPVTEWIVKQRILDCEEWGHDRAIAAIRHSMGAGWRGIFEASGRTTKQDPTKIKAAPGKYDDVRVHKK